MLDDSTWDQLKKIERKSKISEELYDLLCLYLNNLSIGEKKPDMLDDSTWGQLKKIEKKYEISEELYTLLDSLISNKSIGEEKPIVIDDSKWKQIKRIEERANLYSEIESMKIEIDQKSMDLSAERSEVSKLKQKIQGQLSIINDLFSDPTVIDRIETYDNVFAPGNLKNLREIARVIDMESTDNKEEP